MTLERLLDIDRRVIFLSVGLSVLIPLIYPIGMPVVGAPESQAFYDALEALEPGDAILFSFDYEADTRAELDPMAVSVWRYCLERGIRIIALTNYPGGPGVAEAIFRSTASETNATYGKDYVFLGYNADWQGTMLRLGESIRATFPTDQYGTPTDDIPVMAGVDDYDDVPLLVSISSSALAEYWAIFAGGQHQQKVITGNTAIQAILVYPYYYAGQIAGFLGGLKGAAELEVLMGVTGDGKRGMDAQSAGHVLIVVFILIGNVAYFAGRRRNAGKTPGGIG